MPLDTPASNRSADDRTGPRRPAVSRSAHTSRGASSYTWRAAALGLLGLAACQVYDDSLPVQPGAQPDACVPQVEVCNGKDDDCDGVVDERAAALLDCQQHIVHAESVCQSGFCVRLACLSGYYTCDGLNENGCESRCPCGKPCPDGADGGPLRGDASF